MAVLFFFLMGIINSYRSPPTVDWGHNYGKRRLTYLLPSLIPTSVVSGPRVDTTNQTVD
jgi:hypothetical protein